MRVCGGGAGEADEVGGWRGFRVGVQGASDTETGAEAASEEDEGWWGGQCRSVKGGEKPASAVRKGVEERFAGSARRTLDARVSG